MASGACGCSLKSTHPAGGFYKRGWQEKTLLLPAGQPIVLRHPAPWGVLAGDGAAMCGLQFDGWVLIARGVVCKLLGLGLALSEVSRYQELTAKKTKNAIRVRMA